MFQQPRLTELPPVTVVMTPIRDGGLVFLLCLAYFSWWVHGLSLDDLRRIVGLIEHFYGSAVGHLVHSSISLDRLLIWIVPFLDSYSWLKIVVGASLGCLMVHQVTAWMINNLAARIAAVLLMLMPMYSFLGCVLSTELFVVLLINIALLSAWMVAIGHRRCLILFYGSVGIGLFIYGLMGFLFIMTILGAWLLFMQSKSSLRLLSSTWGLLFWLGLFWYLGLVSDSHEVIKYEISTLIYSLLVWVLLTLPWSIIGCLAVCDIYRRSLQGKDTFLMIWFIAALGFSANPSMAVIALWSGLSPFVIMIARYMSHTWDRPIQHEQVWALRVIGLIAWSAAVCLLYGYYCSPVLLRHWDTIGLSVWLIGYPIVSQRMLYRYGVLSLINHLSYFMFVGFILGMPIVTRLLTNI